MVVRDCVLDYTDGTKEFSVRRMDMAVYFYGCISLDGYLATKEPGLAL
jgi:hypothetical protein